MDVLTAFASGLHIDNHGAHHDPHHDACLAQLLDHLHKKRQKSALKLHARIAKHGKPVRQDLKEYSSRLRSNSEAKDVQRLQSNATAFASQLCSELAAWPRLTVDNMHSYRLKVKALRYTLQMAEGDDTPFVTKLGETTDAIGEWHDWSRLLAIATGVLKRSPNCAVSKAIRSTVSAKRHEALHVANTMLKQYLGGRPQLPYIPRKATLSEPALAAIAMLASPTSSPSEVASKAAAHSLPPAATPPSTPANL
jgi:CHAD domain-containing protein